MSNNSHDQHQHDSPPSQNDRREPKGTRGLKRRHLILDTAAELLVEGGIEGVNTNALAERAGISVGSVYQYFSNKEAILNGLGARYLEELEQNSIAVLNQDFSDMTIADMVHRIVDPTIDFERKHPAFGSLVSGLQDGGSLTASTKRVDTSILETIQSLVTRIRPDMPDDDARRVASVTKALYKSMSRFVHQQGLNDAVIGDLKSVMASYLESQLSSHPESPRA